jgi:hypothetical protein
MSPGAQRATGVGNGEVSVREPVAGVVSARADVDAGMEVEYELDG